MGEASVRPRRYLEMVAGILAVAAVAAGCYRYAGGRAAIEQQGQAAESGTQQLETAAKGNATQRSSSSDQADEQGSQGARTYPSSASQSAPADGKIYRDEKYGFALTFDGLWQDYRFIEKVAQHDPSVAAYLYACVPTASHKWEDMAAGVYCPFSVAVIKAGDYEKYKAANDPMAGSYVGQNASYVFLYAPAQDAPEDGESFRQDAAKVISTLQVVR